MRTKRISAVAATCAIASFCAASAHAAIGTINTLVSFNVTNGMTPVSTLIADSSGNLYGTTELGGSSGAGTVFEVAAGTNALTTLATFTGSNGTAPYAGLVADGAGNLYGTTERGGANGDGTVFQITAGTNTLNTLASFSSTTGQNPYAQLTIDSAGNLYGTTKTGTGNYGSVFKVASGSQTITTITTLHNGAIDPEGGVIEDSAGNLFGSTVSGSGTNFGALYEVPVGTTGQVKLLGDFVQATGKFPEGSLIEDSSGNLYGTTYQGGATGYGNVFEYSPLTGTIISLADFTRTTGYYPENSLIMDAAGDLFGTTAASYGGDGSVFEVAAGTDLLTTVATFNTTDGAYPAGALYADSSGNLYGTTPQGGASGDGTVFEITNSGFVPFQSVPEPTSLSLLAMGSLALLRRRSPRAVRI